MDSPMRAWSRGNAVGMMRHAVVQGVPSWLAATRLVMETPSVAIGANDNRKQRYEMVRALSKSVNSKLLGHRWPFENSVVKSARKLTVPVQERSIVFEDELDSAALADFHYHEMRFGGKRLVDWADAGTLGLDEREASLLDAMRAARAGFFDVVEANPKDATIRLKSILPEAGEEVVLSDIALSACANEIGPILLFVRVVRFEDVAMSSGVFFGFPMGERERLLTAHRIRMGTVKEADRSLRRFVFFYRQFQQHGLNQALADPKSLPEA